MSEQQTAPAAGGQGGDAASAAANLAATNDANTEQNAAPPPFWDGFKNPELRGYMAKKQFADPEILADSYRNLEKFHGVPQDKLLKLPDNLEDPEAVKPILAKLGFSAPETADDYKFTDIEGADPEFAKTAAGWMHELGVPERLARPLAEKWTAFAKAQGEAIMAEAAEQTAVELGALQAEWGGKYDENVEAARRAVRSFGFSQEQLEAIEQSVGAAEMYRKFKAIGDKLGESNFVEGNAKPKGFASPEAALSEIASLKNDKDFAKRLMAGDQSAKERWARLHQMAYPEQR